MRRTDLLMMLVERVRGLQDQALRAETREEAGRPGPCHAESVVTKYDLLVNLGLALKGQSSGRIVIGFKGDYDWYAVTA